MAGDSRNSPKKDSLEPGLAQFYNASQNTTNGYLARAVVNTVLKGDLGAEYLDGDSVEDSCKIS